MKSEARGTPQPESSQMDDQIKSRCTPTKSSSSMLAGTKQEDIRDEASAKDASEDRDGPPRKQTPRKNSLNMFDSLTLRKPCQWVHQLWGLFILLLVVGAFDPTMLRKRNMSHSFCYICPPKTQSIGHSTSLMHINGLLLHYCQNHYLKEVSNRIENALKSWMNSNLSRLTVTSTNSYNIVWTAWFLP